jgi:CheY-like chemotaxis protein/anti-sigma regulatory factor (Ser/Thr protein kinase)
MRPVAQECDVHLEDLDDFCHHACVAADRTRLKQVLLNLLSNAIKYNRRGGSVRVHCSADGDALRLAVSDSGPGIAPEQRERLFTAFERLGAETGPIEGAGIGLALSRRLVELMHGRIGIDSQVGHGSTFWLRLPRAEPVVPAAPAAHTAAPRPAAAGACTVLYIEDNPVNVMLMEAMLEREPGVRLVTAQLPELGLELARSECPDLILLDIQLPGLDGYEVLRRLRALPLTRETTVVAVTANAMPGDLERGRAAGFDAYLTKPLMLEALLALVRGALKT